MESYSSFQNWWESVQRELRLDTIFSLVAVDLDQDEQQQDQHADAMCEVTLA